MLMFMATDTGKSGPALAESLPTSFFANVEGTVA
jgi:hypothetical protein